MDENMPEKWANMIYALNNVTKLPVNSPARETSKKEDFLSLDSGKSRQKVQYSILMWYCPLWLIHMVTESTADQLQMEKHLSFHPVLSKSDNVTWAFFKFKLLTNTCVGDISGLDGRMVALTTSVWRCMEYKPDQQRISFLVGRVKIFRNEKRVDNYHLMGPGWV